MVVPFVSTSTAWEKAFDSEKPKIFFQHLDHVVVGMVIIIEKDDVIQGLKLIGSVVLDFRIRRCRSRNS